MYLQRTLPHTLSLSLSLSLLLSLIKAILTHMLPSPGHIGRGHDTNIGVFRTPH